MIYNASAENSIINQYVSELRDIDYQKNSLLFRNNIERISMLLAYEISKHLTYESLSVRTSLGEAEVMTPSEFPVLLTILRAGLPMQNGMLKIFDKSSAGFISAYRKHSKSGDFSIQLEYITCPDLNNKVVILSDPMLATGQSIDLTLTTLNSYGNIKKLIICCVIASQEGVEFIKQKHPNVDIYTAAIDEELTAKAYIVPGLGDAGDLSFGEKLQS